MKKIIYTLIFNFLLAVNVTLQVDMSTVELSPEGVHVAGSFQDWNPSSDLLTLLEDQVYSITFEMEVGESHEYKFINGDDWSGEEFGYGVNRTLTVPESDTVLAVVCFGDITGEPCDETELGNILTSLTFYADLSNSDGFSLGDSLYVKWGYGGTQSFIQSQRMIPEFLSYDYYITIDSVLFDPEAGLYYQYYKLDDGEEFREVYFNFDYSGSDIALAERRFSDFSNLENGDSFQISDNIDSNVDPNRQPVFLDTEPIGTELTVTYTVDLRPAYYQVLSGTVLEDIQGATDVELPEQVFEWGVWINGPASTPTNGEDWTGWGATLWNTEEKQMWDDGTHGDLVASDSVYSIQITYDENDSKGQEFKFGIRGGDNESGYGLNHIENIDVSNPVVQSFWGSINPYFYNAWDYDSNFPLSITNNEIPNDIILGNNYPNPFNPETSFDFSITKSEKVKISIYDITGKFIIQLKSENLNPGNYQVNWNGKDFKNSNAPSGTYIYELKTDSGVRITKKMTLVK